MKAVTSFREIENKGKVFSRIGDSSFLEQLSFCVSLRVVRLVIMQQYF